MRFKQFINEAGLKVLAVARLGQCEYSVVLYILNTAVSGLDHFITTDTELAGFIGYDEDQVREALATLESRNIIRMNYGDSVHTGKPSVRISLQYDLAKWQIDQEKGATSHDAVVFPFRRHGSATLKVFDGEKSKRDDKADAPTWHRVLESFLGGRHMDDDEIARSEDEARVLVETHPVDQILLMIRHFGGRIPTLSLLASSWHHFQELFEEETQKVDLLGARQKHQELDDKVRKQAEDVLASMRQELSEEERTVLQILINHRHPRRQLFWAYQTRNRYPKLGGFFEEMAPLMLAVTSTGSIVKRPQFD